MPDRTRSRISSRSNSAMEPKIPNTSRPLGVDVSTPSCRLMKSIPRLRNSSRGWKGASGQAEQRRAERARAQGGAGALEKEAREIAVGFRLHESHLPAAPLRRRLAEVSDLRRKQ